MDFFKLGDKPSFILGINYQSAESGHLPEFWEDSAFAEIIDRDFCYMRQMGIQAIRIQCAKFHRPETFDAILGYAQKHGIYLIPNLNLGDLTKGDISDWFLAQGASIVHLSEENPRFKNEQPDPFVEPLLSQEKAYLESLLSQYKDEEMILGWDISNEPTYHLYGGSSGKYAQYCGKDSQLARQITTQWAKELYHAAKRADPNHPITIGVDHSILVMDTGFDFIGFSEANDFISTHSYSRNVAGYLMVDDACSIRDTYFLAFISKISQLTGNPFVSGECGNNSYCMSERHQGLHYRVMLYSSLINGAVGIFPWCFHSYDLSSPTLKKTYDSAPSEAEFGIVRPDHTDKPAAVEYRRFAQVAGQIDFSQYSLRPAEVAILVPRQYYDYLDEHRASLFNSFVLAKQAHFNVEFTQTGQDWSKYKLLVSPTNYLLISEMEQIEDFVRNGGNLYISITNGLGGWATYLKDLLAADVENFIIAPEEIVLQFQQDFGDIGRGTKMTYRSDTWSYFHSHHKPENERQYFTFLKPTGARVLATDQFGHPALLLNEAGNGKVLVCCFGVEYFLSNMPGVYHTDRTYTIYQALGRLCGLKFPAQCNHPFLELGCLAGQDDSLLFVINHENLALQTKLAFRETPSRVSGFLDGETVALDTTGEIPLNMEENGVKILRIEP